MRSVDEVRAAIDSAVKQLRDAPIAADLMARAPNSATIAAVTPAQFKALAAQYLTPQKALEIRIIAAPGARITVPVIRGR